MPIHETTVTLSAHEAQVIVKALKKLKKSTQKDIELRKLRRYCHIPDSDKVISTCDKLINNHFINFNE